MNASVLRPLEFENRPGLPRAVAPLLAALLLGIGAPCLAQQPAPTTPTDPESVSPVLNDGSAADAGAAATPEVELQDRRVLTLDEARTTLRTSSTTLAITEQSIVAAQTLEAQAWAIWYPTANLTAVYTLNDNEVTFAQPNPYAPLLPYLDSVYGADPALQDLLAANPGTDVRDYARAASEPIVVQNRHDYRVTATVTQTLFNYRALPLLSLATLTVQQAETGREQASFQLETALLRLYFNAVTFRRLIPVSERNVELARINHQSASARLDEGVGLRFAVNRAQVAVSSAERELQNARLSYALAIDAVATLLEREPDFDVELPPPLEVPEAQHALVEQAVERRAVVRSAELATVIEEGWGDEVDARFWPVVRAQGQAWLQRGSAFGGDDFRWALMLIASWDLYDGGFRDVERAQHEVAAVQHSLQRALVEHEVESQLRQAWLALRTQQATVASARDEAALAAENVELTEAARELDSATPVDVELAQRQRYLAELALVSAEIQLQARIYELYQLAGAFALP